MVTVDDAQEQADLLQGLIDSLPSVDDPNTVSPQIQTEALTLHSMLISFSSVAAVAAHEAAGTFFDSQIS
jgi:hypothetical protein